MHKKKIQTLIAAGVLSVGIIGGTLAWFTSQDQVTNMFNSGSTDNPNNTESGIDITEDFIEEDAKNVIPGDDVNKDVQVLNTASYDQFIRVKFDKQFVQMVNGDRKDLADNKITIDGRTFTLDTDLIELMFTTHLKDLNSSSAGDWVLGSDGYYYYIGAVAAKDKTQTINNWTNTLLDAVNLCKTVGNEYKNIGFDVDVIADSIQATNNAVNDWSTIPEDIKTKLSALQTDIAGIKPVAPKDIKEVDGANDNCQHSPTNDGCNKEPEHGSTPIKK